MEWVIQGIGGGIVVVALFRLVCFFVALWRLTRYRKQQRRFARDAFYRRVQVAKVQCLERKRPEPAVTPTVSGIEVVFVRSGRTCTWDPSIGSLLEQRQRAHRMSCRQVWKVSHGYQIRSRLVCDGPSKRTGRLVLAVLFHSNGHADFGRVVLIVCIRSDERCPYRTTAKMTH